MKIFQKFIKQFTIVFCLLSGFIYAGVAIDGTNEIIEVWQEPNQNALLKIRGSYGTSNPAVVDIVNSSNIQAMNAVLASSNSASASTRAVVVWLEYEVSSGIQTVHVATCSNSGWTPNSGQLISSASEEEPQSDFSVAISNDGQVIGITWSSYLLQTQRIVTRSVKSTDGGVQWSQPVTLG